MTTLAVSNHPGAIEAVRRVLRDVDSAHVSSIQGSFIAPDISVYRPEIWNLWEQTGDPDYLLKLAYLGDESAIDAIRDFVDSPREYRLVMDAHPQDRDITMSRLKSVLENRGHPLA